MSPTAEPAPEPAPEPGAQPEPTAAHEPAPESGAQPAPEPATQPATQPAPQPAPEPGAQPAPQPGAQPDPAPAPQPGTQPAPPQPGALHPLLASDPSSLAGYRLLGRLGAGGMGVVYLGRTGNGELAAVKVTHAGHADQADFRARFRREVEAARRVSSPWAVPVTGADPDAPEPWMATAFVPGPSLGEAVAAHGPLPERSVRILGGALARALAAVHEAGLVHRDVKPGNVLLAVDGPRLIDFGIARTTGETALTSTGMVVGTPGFLAPEQAEARAVEIGPPSDVFALGCLLAHAATGRPPFGTGAVDALLYRTVHDEPDLDGVPDGPAGLLDLVRSCLAKDPADRPAAEEVAARLTEDTPGAAADWLPAPVVRTIAERSAAMLALPAIEATHLGASDTGDQPAPSRRTFLLLASGGAALATTGSLAAWAALHDDGKDRKATPPPKKRRWVIGVQADLTGPAKDIGRAQERGARLAVEQFNSRKDKPFTLELKVSDDAGDKNRAPAAARVLTGDPDVLGVLGPTSDYTGLAALPAYDEALVPLITVSAGLNLLANTGAGQGLSVLQACPQHAIAGTSLAYYVLTKTRSIRPGLLQERTDDTYAWQYIGGANFVFRRVNVRLVPRVVPASTTDYKRVLGAMMAEGMDAYVHCGLTPSAVLAARALDELGFTGMKITGQHVFEPRFLAEAGAAAEGWVLGAPVVDATTVKEASPFVAAHRKRYGAAPAFYTGESFDVVNLLIQEVEKIAKAGKRPDRTTLATLLRKVQYQGVMGSYLFDPQTGQLRSDAVGTFMYVVENGRYKPLEFAPAGPPKNRRI